MATIAARVHAEVTTKPRSFTPPGSGTARLSHLDPRPLWLEPVAVESPWKSASFWLACAIVTPVAGIVRLMR